MLIRSWSMDEDPGYHTARLRSKDWLTMTQNAWRPSRFVPPQIRAVATEAPCDLERLSSLTAALRFAWAASIAILCLGRRLYLSYYDEMRARACAFLSSVLGQPAGSCET